VDTRLHTDPRMSNVLGMRLRGAASALLCTVLLAGTGCRKNDNSEDTDEAADELNKAEGAAARQQQGVVSNQADVEHAKREVVAQQQALDDKQALLAQQRAALGSAQVSLEAARGVYAKAVAERLAKLDAALATLSKRTDAASTDASTGLHARRDQLAQKLGSLKTTADPAWATYTKDVDTTFDAIEHDLQNANH
jgi:chromosome segregation ATPase